MTAVVLFIYLPAIGQNSTFVQHTADNSNIFYNVTALTDTNLDNISNQQPVFTHNWNPGGVGGTYADYKMGLWYSTSKWNIFNQDLSNFVSNTTYNIFIARADASSWEHVTANANLSGNYTIIDHPKYNNDPNAMLFITDSWSTGVYNEKIMGVFYSNSLNMWCIFDQNGVANNLEEDLAFHIVAPNNPVNYAAFQHTADVNNSTNNRTAIDHPDLNNNPDAVVIVTQNWNPGGGSGVYNNHNVGVYYNGTKWAVYNENLNDNMPMGASFNVIAFKNQAPTGIDKPKQTSFDVNVFPNPVSASGLVTLTLDEEINGSVELTIMNMTGETILKESFVKQDPIITRQLAIPEVMEGIYILQIHSNGKIGSQKLFVR